MDTALAAIEVTATVDEAHQLHLDTALPIAGPRRVRVIVLYADDGDVNETTWLHAAAHSPAYTDLADPAEDVYTLSDGTPYHDEK